jgi:polysaccharide biosynthesis protein PslA
MHNKTIKEYWYIFTDWLASIIAWLLLVEFRTYVLQQYTSYSNLMSDLRFWQGIILIPLGWIVLYALVGSYKNLYKKSRLAELNNTFIVSLIGCIIIFFVVFLNDVPFANNFYTYYYKIFLVYFLLHNVIVSIMRLIILGFTKKQLQNKVVQFNTLVIGNNKEAVTLYENQLSHLQSFGFNICGFINGPTINKNGLNKYLTNYGNLNNLSQVIEQQQIKQVIIALNNNEQQVLENVLTDLSEKDVDVKIIPSMFDIIWGKAKTSNVTGALLIDLETGIMPDWQQNIKRLIDVTVSFISIVICCR